MINTDIYRDIGTRAGGDIYIGVVGPVRTGKSSFIKRFMDILVFPNMANPYEKTRIMHRNCRRNLSMQICVLTFNVKT